MALVNPIIINIPPKNRKKSFGSCFLRLILVQVALVTIIVFSSTLFGQTNVIRTIAGNGTSGFSGDGAAATAARMYNVWGIAIDDRGNLYLADFYNERIRKIDTNGIINTIAGNGRTGFSGDSSAATAASFNYPYGLALDQRGNIYIADYYNNRIRKIDTGGMITTIVGMGSGAYGGDGHAASNASLNGPTGIAIDSSGNIYIADYLNSRVRKVDASGIITTIAGNGTLGFSGDGGAATDANLQNPIDVAVDRSGNIYIADQGNYRVRKVNTSGLISTIAGNGTSSSTGDGGPATDAGVFSPYGLALDDSGNLYIAEYYRNHIRKVWRSGMISTEVGTGDYGFSGDGGPATDARVNYPARIAVSRAGILYISDGYNYRIRKVNQCTLPSVAAILGATTLCLGDTTRLTNTTAGGVWSTTSTSIATINSISGVVTGIDTGVATITYTITDTCGFAIATTSLNIVPLPRAGIISGIDSICLGDTATLHSSSSGGHWYSSNTTIASVDSVTGLVTGLARAATNIFYVVGNSCGNDTSRFNIYPHSSCFFNIDGIELQNLNLSIYPNTNSGRFFAEISCPSKKVVSLTVTNLVGEKVKELAAVTNQRVELDLRIPAGMYFVNAIVDGQRLMKKIVVEN